MAAKMSHAEWLERKERDLEDERYEKMLEDRKQRLREEARKEQSKQQFAEWLQHKESFERALQLLDQLDSERCADTEQWFEVAIALSAVDCLRGVYKQDSYRGLPCDRDPAHNVSREELRKRRTLQSEFYKWSKHPEHGHEFENVPVDQALAKTFSLNAQEVMSEYAEQVDREGDFIIPSLKYTAPRAKQAAHDKRNLHNPDTAKYNKIFHRLLQAEYARAQEAMYERLDKATAKTDLQELPLDAAERRVLSALGLGRLAKWVEEDATRRDTVAENRKKEDRQYASQVHDGFIAKKNRMRVRLPDDSDDDDEAATRLDDEAAADTFRKKKRVLYGTRANKENGRMDFSRGAPKAVRTKRGSMAATNSVEIIARSSGAAKQKYAYATNRKDLEAARSSLRKEGHLFRENFRDEDGDALDDDFRAAKESQTRRDRIRELVRQREEKAAETYKEWAAQKDLRSRALDALQHIDKPGSSGEGGATDETHWRYVGEQLKAVDPALFADFVQWSVGFKTAAKCKATWDLLPPNVCDTCNPSSTVHNVLLKFLNRPGIDFAEIFDFAVDREVRRMMASDGREASEATPEEVRKIEDTLELNPKRFRQMMQDAGIAVQPHEVRILTTLFDTDGNDRISRKEFLSFTGHGPRPGARGDALLTLRAGDYCSWEACCHVTGLTSAYDVRPAPVGTGNADDEDDQDAYETEFSQDEGDQDDDTGNVVKSLPLLLRNGKVKQGWVRTPLPDFERRARRVLRTGDREPADFRKPPPSSCEVSKWSLSERMSALEGLEALAETNREISRTLALQTQGESPLCPVLELGPVHEFPEADRQTALMLRWRPREGSMFPTFYVLESCGREGSKSHRQHEFKEIFRDPPSAASGKAQAGEFTLRGLEAGVRYLFRIRAFNGYGSSPFTYASFLTAPAPPAVPVVKSLAPTTLTLAWGNGAPTVKTSVREIRDVFRALDTANTGAVDPESFLDTLENAHPQLYAALETMAAPDLPGGSLIDTIEALPARADALSWSHLKTLMVKAQSAPSASSSQSRGLTYVLCRCVADEEVDFQREGSLSAKRSTDDVLVSVLRGSDWYVSKAVANPGDDTSAPDAQAIAERLDVPRPYFAELPLAAKDAHEKPALKVVLKKRRARRHPVDGATDDTSQTAASLPSVGQLDEPVTHLEVYEIMYRGSEPRCVLTGLQPGSGYQFRVFSLSVPPREAASGPTSMSVSSSTVTSRMSAALVVHMPAVAPPAPRIVHEVTTDAVSLQWTTPDLELLNRRSRAKESLNAKKDSWNKVVGEWAQDPRMETKGGVSDATLRKTFMRYDKNVDGKMDAQELAELFGDLGLRVQGPSFTEAMQELDTNGDGVVSYTEFANWWRRPEMTHVLLHREAVGKSAAATAGTAAATTTTMASSAAMKASSTMDGPSPALGAMSRPNWHVVYRGTKTEARVTGLAPNTRHIFALQCELRRSLSTPSNDLVVFTAPETPRQPVVVEAGPRHFRVKWYPGFGGAHRYVLEAMLVERLPDERVPAGNKSQVSRTKQRGPIPPTERQWITVYDGKDTLALVSDLEVCAMYRLRVKALNADKIESAPSLPAQFATTTARDTLTRRAAKTNAARFFSIECTGDLVTGDTILFTERVFAAPGEDPFPKRGRRKSAAPYVASLSQQSVSSLDGPKGSARGVFVAERTVAARIQGALQRKTRELVMEVLWSTLSVPTAPEKYHLLECARITRSEHEIFKFETFRASWAQEDARWSYQDELEAAREGSDLH
ncbi:Calmodulin [Hondaea fermentalgiana]|uniref:Calmodulin n=1 Tax=Hondaea fermentalgiana TaxID=2315210 RepID=A0A2R5G3W2_9STRA|nr:Calmodulin [Hondaea fermentalgiana]|eukprot:GBG25712.1 Calmodulin [Hondaea fermentalgiana]